MEVCTFGLEPGAICLEGWTDTGDQRPKIRTVIVMAQVADFVGDKIIDYGLGG